MGGWKEHPLEWALERYFLGKQHLSKPLETVGAPRWKGVLEENQHQRRSDKDPRHGQGTLDGLI